MASIKGSFQYSKKLLSKINDAGENAADPFVVVGSTFLEAIQTTDYKCVLDLDFEYDIYLESTKFHWFLMVRSRSGKFPFIILEITTHVHNRDIIPAMRAIPSTYGADDGFSKANIAYLRKAACRNQFTDRIKDFFGLPTELDDASMSEIMLHLEGFNPKIKGTKRITMKGLCATADSICAEMAKKMYNLRNNNCQHFCNKVLSHFDLPTTKPTLAGEEGLEESDKINEVFVLEASVNEGSGKCSGNGLKG